MNNVRHVSFVRRATDMLRRAADALASKRLARDLGLPVEPVARVLDQVMIDVENLTKNGDHADCRPAIAKATKELERLGVHAKPTPLDEGALDKCLSELTEPHLTILNLSRAGMKLGEIATLVGMDVPLVRRSLVKTYADLRMKMMGCGDDDNDDNDDDDDDGGDRGKAEPAQLSARIA